MNFGILVWTASHVKFAWQRNYKAALESLESSCPINLLKLGVGSSFSEEFPLMEVWNGWVFLTSTGPMGPLGILISFLLFLVGETEVPPLIRTGGVNLEGLMEVFLSRGIFLSVSFRFTTTWFWKARALLHAASVTISFNTIVWRAWKVLLLSADPSAIGGSIYEMLNEMVRLINKFCGEFPLVVSVSVIFLFFLSLVWVATNWSLFGLLSVSSSSKL